jgi:hypothetical protein
VSDHQNLRNSAFFRFTTHLLWINKYKEDVKAVFDNGDMDDPIPMPKP